MPRRSCQLGVRDPQSLLLLPLLARAHRHRAILRTMPVDISHLLGYESRLAPRPARICKDSWKCRQAEAILSKESNAEDHDSQNRSKVLLSPGREIRLPVNG